MLPYPVSRSPWQRETIGHLGIPGEEVFPPPVGKLQLPPRFDQIGKRRQGFFLV